MEMHPQPADPGYAAHVEQLARNIGLSVQQVEEELAHSRMLEAAAASRHEPEPVQ